MAELRPNEGKSLVIEVNGVSYARLPIRTHLITRADDLSAVVRHYVRPLLQPGDIVFVSEKIVAITQGRAFPVKEIAPSRLARFLVRFVHRSPYGIGIGSPWTMELAIREAGRLRILLAAAAAALTKPFGLRGVFYLICGKRVAAIDGPCAYTIPPYNEYAKLGPARPGRVARSLKRELGCEVVIIDANDLGVSVLGKSGAGVAGRFARAVFRDNPLGQGAEQTPLAIVRRTEAVRLPGRGRFPVRAAGRGPAGRIPARA